MGVSTHELAKARDFVFTHYPQPGDIVGLEHWCSSGFANTDLDLQLKEHGIHKLIVIGLRANTCVESTVRFAAELGYEVTMVKERDRFALHLARTATRV